jgi:hypothetical protein
MSNLHSERTLTKLEDPGHRHEDRSHAKRDEAYGECTVVFYDRTNDLRKEVDTCREGGACHRLDTLDALSVEVIHRAREQSQSNDSAKDRVSKVQG